MYIVYLGGKKIAVSLPNYLNPKQYYSANKTTNRI